MSRRKPLVPFDPKSDKPRITLKPVPQTKATCHKCKTQRRATSMRVVRIDGEIAHACRGCT